MLTDLKLGIFIGSTRKDLINARRVVIDAVLSAGHIPSGMELWAAGHIPTVEAIEKHLNLCDVHIIILGARYGSVVKDELSFIEWEYARSKKQKRPIIAFLLEQKAFNKSIKTQPEPIREKLKRFRNELESNALCRYFTPNNVQAIGIDCINSINEAINAGDLKDDAGWIRSRSKHGQRLREIDRNPFLKRILDTIYGFSTLTKRLDKESEAKRTLGEAFWNVMFGRIKRHGYFNLFFESGSTLAYISHEFEKMLRQSEGDRTSETNKWKITTNNAMTLLQFLLHTHIDVIPKPAGAPEDYYGAMFDDVLLKNPEPPPQIPRALFKTEKEAVDRTVTTLQQDGADRLYLATASGLDLNHPQRGFRGPHVGSHPNMLFKRAIFKNDKPIVLFLNASKLQRPFKIGRCYPVFDRNYTWQQACQECKLAICIGYTLNGEDHANAVQRKRKKLIQQLASTLPGFDFNYAKYEGDCGGAFIIANDKFTKSFPKE